MNEEPNEEDPRYLLIAPAVSGSARIIADFVHACVLLDMNVATSNLIQELDSGDKVVTHIRAAAW